MRGIQGATLWKTTISNLGLRKTQPPRYMAQIVLWVRRARKKNTCSVFPDEAVGK